MAEQATTNQLENEAEIVERAKTDDQAFALLYEFYFPKIYGYILKRVGNRTVAEDIVSLTFMKVFANLKSFKHQGVGFGPWVYRIATNNLTDHYRRSGRRPEDNLEEHTQISDETPGAEIMMQSSQDQELVREIIKIIPKRYQEALHLKYFAQLEYHEMAATLKISENNARVLVFRALKYFQNIYEQYGN